MNKHRRRLIATAISSGIVALSAGTLLLIGNAVADNPKPGMRNILGATTGEFTLYQVKPGMEQQFVDALVKAGPYDKQIAGLASEKVLAPLSGVAAAKHYMSVARYFDDISPKRVRQARDQQLLSFLVTPPVQVTGKLIGHVFADWGWEKNRGVQMTEVDAVDTGGIFKQKLTTLSFLKTGYTGQSGLLEFLESSATVEQVKSDLKQRQGLTGASIYDLGGRGYAVYSEYFSTPEKLAAGGFNLAAAGDAIPAGRQGGMVELNYSPR